MKNNVIISSIGAVVSLIIAVYALFMERMYNDMSFSLSNQQMWATIMIIFIILTVVFIVLAFVLNRRSS